MTTAPSTREAIYTVVGGGAIGGTLATHLALAGRPVQIVDTDSAHIAAIHQKGMRIESPSGVLETRIPAFELADAPSELGPVLLAVKSQATGSAMEWIAPRLRNDGYVASLQNGLNEATIAKHIGADRTVIAFVDLFADLLEPGVIQDGGIGTIALGEFAGGRSTRVDRLAEDLAHWGSPIVSGNVSGFLWSKLAFGAMLTASSFIDEDMSKVISENRSPMLGLAREIFAVSDALGLRLEGFDAFAPDNYRVNSSDRTINGAFDLLSEWLAGQTKTRSGIWRDINVRKRPTEVPSHYKPVFTVADEQGVETPKLRAMVEVIGELERDESSMGASLMQRVDKA
ncbi:ketopantoate reductase family protein [Brevibacterium sp. UCMA 11754]|uniref:ketopantoate reductase family protein n=1 Tax=Brevibacterium sp. UCMA 11754 TaxID=2749198 RepID=UPI001F3FEFE2|nr:2-dehydropantoate 2-reductase N-terminal domain-containing protein [Brevibacterium sp. UCMA 11754]MCF2570922.1 ketopantoate reductase family protein [Brevibacterium sp. UCMA 11754]